MKVKFEKSQLKSGSCRRYWSKFKTVVREFETEEEGKAWIEYAEGESHPHLIYKNIEIIEN